VEGEGQGGPLLRKPPIPELMLLGHSHVSSAAKPGVAFSLAADGKEASTKKASTTKTTEEREYLDGKSEKEEDGRHIRVPVSFRLFGRKGSKEECVVEERRGDVLVVVF